MNKPPGHDSLIRNDYRPDIDGLRAVAVLAVIFYHLGATYFPGGYVGVDVFFVISGYLITRIIWKRISEKNFSFRWFYTRRVRRIVPALAAVSIFNLVVGYVLLLPFDYRALGDEVAYANLGLSNIYFYLNSGYFAREAQYMPMLHTWSLSVEEQFYLIWPGLLLIFAFFRGNALRVLVSTLCAIAIASFFLSVYFVDTDQPFSFFMLPTRAWELALGAALAFAPAIRKARLAEAANIAGLLLIGCGIVFLTEDSAFPGYNALYPCLGAALVVWPKRSATLSGQLLAWRPMVLIGLISYSLYLWHWPVITYFRIYNIGHDIGEFEGTLLLSISFLLAFASWKYIEMPFRQWRAPDWRIISAGLSTIGICVLIGIGLHGANGAPWRLSDEERKIAQYMGYKSGFGKEICRLEGDDIKLSCPAHNERQPNVLLMGDSHAIHFARALPITFPNVNFFIAARSGCRPVIDAVASDGKDECVELMDWVFHEAVPNMWFDSIILSARWRNGHSEQLPATVAYLRKYTDRVIVFGQTMEYRTSLPEMMLVDALPREESNLNRKDRFDEVSRLNMQIISALRSTGAEVFLPSEAICPAGRCSSQTPTGALYQFDKAHLTLDGATEVLSRFKRLGLSFGQEPNRAASVSMIKR